MGSQSQEELKGRGTAPRAYPLSREGHWGSATRGGKRLAGGVQVTGNGTCWIEQPLQELQLVVCSTCVIPYVSACCSRDRLKCGFNYLQTFHRQRKSKRLKKPKECLSLLLDSLCSDTQAVRPVQAREQPVLCCYGICKGCAPTRASHPQQRLDST